MNSNIPRRQGLRWGSFVAPTYDEHDKRWNQSGVDGPKWRAGHISSPSISPNGNGGGEDWVKNDIAVFADVVMGLLPEGETAALYRTWKTVKHGDLKLQTVMADAAVLKGMGKLSESVRVMYQTLLPEIRMANPFEPYLRGRSKR
jgi:hypothetical protein